MSRAATCGLCSPIGGEGGRIVGQCTVIPGGLLLQKTSTVPRATSAAARGTPLIFYRRIVTSFSLFSPYCRALTFNGSFPRVETIVGSVCCWDRRRHDDVGLCRWGVCAHAMKGHEQVRQKRDKKIIRQEQSDKQRGQGGGGGRMGEARGGDRRSSELIGIVRGT